MGYNISEVTGATGGPSDWSFTLDLSDPTATTVTGDFDVVSLFTGASLGEAADGYTFSALSDPSFGSLSFDTTDGTFTFTVDRAAVIASGSDQSVSFTIIGTDGAFSDDDTVTINILICLNRGTIVETAEGPKPVEALAVGDRIPTLDGTPQPIRWIGSRWIPGVQLRADSTLWPIRIGRDSLGLDLPRQDLLVSPQHRVHLSGWRAQLLFGEDEVLVPAKALVNDDTICVDRSVKWVEYFHVLFDEHQVIFTEGLPTESFHPGAYSLRELDEGARDELLKLFPHLAQDSGYGAAARPSLKPWEGALLGHAPGKRVA